MTTATIAARLDARTQIKTLGLVSAAHMLSHVYWLAFAPILPDLRALLGVSYTDVALAITIMNLVSAATQAPVGFISDRVGPRALLVAGLILGGLGFIAIGLWPSYPMFVAGAAVIGLANAVYHPADYSILSAEMSAPRMGRAFSVHAFTGYLGFAVAPIIMAGVSQLEGVRVALVIVGLLGPLTALPFLPDCLGERTKKQARVAQAAPQAPSARSLLTPAVILLTVMYTALNLGTNILQTFMIVALGGLHHLPESLGKLCLSLFLAAMVVGVLAGGFLADRAKRQSLITGGGFGLAAALVVLVGLVDLGPQGTIAALAAAGFVAGIIMPSRDLLTRAASPPGAVGRVFGIVTTGFNFGGMASPLIGGYLVDHDRPAWIFFTAAFFMAVTVLLSIRADADARAQPAWK